MGLQIGDRAPEVVLPSHTLERVALKEVLGGRPTVIHFFPLAFSSTCTAQLCTARDQQPELAGLDAQVVAISVDSPYVLSRYREALGADYLFLSDFNREASVGFGVLRQAPVGPGLLNASDRAAFVVDGAGVIRYAWHSTNPGLLPPFEEIREAVSRLAGV